VGEPRTSDDAGTPADLAAAVLEEEARRQAERAERHDIVLPDDLLPGVGGEGMALRTALRRSGVRTALVVGMLGFIDQFDRSALEVLGPDIQRTLGISDTVLGVIAGAFGVLFLLGSVPISTLADRVPRKIVASVSMTVWSAIVFVTGFVVNGFSLFVARMGAGLGVSYSLPVNSPLLIDTYPIEARSKVFALNGAFQMAGIAVSPLFAGGLASLANHHLATSDGWRYVFFAIGVLALPIAMSALLIREPRRGRHEMRAVLGHELEEDEGELPISVSVAFERLRKIRSFYSFLLGMAALGFALFSTPIFLNLFFDKQLGLSAFERGLVGSITILPGFAAVAAAGRRGDELFRRSPPGAFVFIGGLVALYGAFLTTAVWMPNVWTVVPMLAIAVAFSRAAFAIMPAAVSTIIPYRLRSRGVALIGVYLFLFGAFFGAVLTGILSDAFGERVALSIIVPPSTVIGGILMAIGARNVRRDISLVVEELREEQEEHARMSEEGAHVPVLQVRNLDFSYGRVQVLFDVAFEVRRGEVLAILGTNGAGKSTILRVVSGLGVPERGVVRLNGRTITYADPEQRALAGIVQLSGGRAVFGPMSVRENLEMAGFRYPGADLEARIDRSLDLFPVLRERLHESASDLSGGQQQMLALAMALLHDPEILLIDELSLGLAPTAVQELIAVVEQLKGQGTTIVIVEQSLNVALSIADRAIFLEKGEIRFEGPARDLLARDDLARAVFLGADRS
jgi:ABC-type branched-subunit amino acid transport system ATPase component/predicted MFS family arabinose efflux permease